MHRGMGAQVPHAGPRPRAARRKAPSSPRDSQAGDEAASKGGRGCGLGPSTWAQLGAHQHPTAAGLPSQGEAVVTPEVLAPSTLTGWGLGPQCPPPKVRQGFLVGWGRGSQGREALSIFMVLLRTCRPRPPPGAHRPCLLRKGLGPGHPASCPCSLAPVTPERRLEGPKDTGGAGALEPSLLRAGCHLRFQQGPGLPW